MSIPDSDAADALGYAVQFLGKKYRVHIDLALEKPPAPKEKGAALEGEYLPPRPAPFLGNGKFVGRWNIENLKKVGES